MPERRFDPDIPELPPEYHALLPTLDDFIAGLPDKYKKSLIGPQHAVLDEDGNPQPATLIQWASWLEKDRHQRIIDRTEIMRKGEGLVPELYVVSTVFLGLNHQYTPGAKPLWFECMVFAPPVMKYWQMFKHWRTTGESLWMDRCETRPQACAMHAKGVDFVRDYIAQLGTEPYQYEREPTERSEALPAAIQPPAESGL